ncbi:hypothetical protein PFICI_12672 [Pestalotiopsis fici W106-1]|uniref:Uncharacterized protein n=1 Tax=Pestalotiopsis fici (strain W106-1 / CGMCC3.15140) TaxID=1229662 RepID=W3WPF6_PESFW|nr:uncharacterized protein PFICI_12672 [Pestalotiopsis fici W106-1]ETS75728.1 hypothetical protein PFICI_12672 [Pestalotiopsis fici W106-1]
MANVLVPAKEWIHPALREPCPTATEEQSALEYATPLMIKYAYEKYRYNLTPREVYEILYEGCWEGVDDFVEYMQQDMSPTPEGLRVYTFEEVDAMDAALRKGECAEEEIIEDFDDESEDDEEEQVRNIRDVLEDGGEDTQFFFRMLERDEEDNETEEDLMPLDPLPLYESQCGDDEAILESDMPPSFSPGPAPPEYTAQALVLSCHDQVVENEEDLVATIVEDYYSEVDTEVEVDESVKSAQEPIQSSAISQFWPSPLGTAGWTQDKISNSRRVFTSTAVKVVPALVIMGTLLWRDLQGKS